MRSALRSLVILALVASSVLGQAVSTVYFSPRTQFTPASGRGGDNLSVSPPCGGTSTPGPLAAYINESALVNSQGIAYVQPGVPNTTIPFSGGPQSGTPATDYVEIVNYPQFNLIIGDLDADGVADELTNFEGVDAIYIPFATAGRPNNIHEMFVSTFADSAGNQGFLGASITEADMVLLPRAPNPYPTPSVPAAPIFFVRQTDWETFFGLPTTAAIDVDAFTVDQATGDIYASFDAASTNCFSGAQVRTTPGGPLQAVTITRGDVVRIPGAAYTPSGPFGVVTQPLGGFAELVLTASQVASMVSLAGGTYTITPVDTFALDLDPQGDLYFNPGNGFVMPHLLLTVESSGGAASGPQIATAAAIYSTIGGGSFAAINGVTMNQPSALGVRNLSWSVSFWSGAIDALDVIVHAPAFDPVNDRPLHLDAFPNHGLLTGANALTWTGVLTGHISNAAPGAVLAILGGVDFVPSGGFLPRWDVSSAVQNYPDLYVDPFQIASQSCLLAPTAFAPFSQTFAQALISSNPVMVWVDPVNASQNGDCCFQFDISAFVPPAPNQPPPFMPPPLITFQAVDLANLRLSTPVSFQFN